MLEEEVYGSNSPIWDPEFSQASSVPSWMSPNAANTGIQTLLRNFFIRTPCIAAVYVNILPDDTDATKLLFCV